VPFVSDCFVEPPYCDTLIVLSHRFTVLSECATMLSPSRFAKTTCASYATCHLTKHTRLVLFPTRVFLSRFPSRVLSSIHLCDMNKVDITSPNLVVCRFFLRLTFYISLSFSLSLRLFFCFFLGWRTPNLIAGLSGW